MQTTLIIGSALIVTAVLAVFIYILLQGNEKISFLTADRSALSCEYLDEQKAIFSLTIPFCNAGTQEGIMTDAFARVLLPREQFSLASINSRLEKADERRDDGYLEAFIGRIGQKGDFILTLEITSLNRNSMDDILNGIVDMTIDIYYVVTGRTSPKIRKDSLTLLLEEFQQAAKGVNKE